MDVSQLDRSSFQPYCTERMVDETLRNCSASNSSPDGISYKVLKAVAQHFLAPLNIIFQQSLHAVLFPATWKHAIITPLFKSRGDHSNPASYRPISICSCLGKLLERVMQKQLIEFLKFNDRLCYHQHGFVAGRSTLTNVITCDKIIADAVLSGHAYDVLFFDFKAAFDKAPHRLVIESLAAI